MKTISNFTFQLLKLVARPLAFFKWKYHYKSFYKIEKGQPIVVLSNHQTDYDPILIHLSFNRLMHTIATDNLFKNGAGGKFLRKLGAIPKRKGMTDVKSNLEVMNLVKEGESILFFPEGNRSYAEFQYFIGDSIGNTIKKLGTTLILFNIHGGNGRYPRFANRPRMGKFWGEIVRVLHYEEYKDMDDAELSKLIKATIRVFDSESHELYKGVTRAEYLERMFFVCPICGKPHQLMSRNEKITCKSCGLEVTFNEDLTLTGNNNFPYTRLVEWYNYQKRWVKELEITKGMKIFEDDKVVFRTANPEEKSKILFEGKMELYEDKLVFGDIAIDVKDIIIASPVSKRKLVFSTEEGAYEVRGDVRFNALKYVLMFNRLDTKMKGTDKYYTLEEEQYDIR